MSGLGGQAADIDIYAREILRMRQSLNEILADATGQPIEKIARDVDRDYILEPQAALEYGMIDRVISSRQPLRYLLDKRTVGNWQISHVCPIFLLPVLFSGIGMLISRCNLCFLVDVYGIWENYWKLPVDRRQ